MKIIEITALPNGAHRNQTVSGSVTVPEGWAIIPEGMSLPATFPFVSIEAGEVTHYREVEKLREVTGTREVPALDEEGSPIYDEEGSPVLVTEEYTGEETVVEMEPCTRVEVISMTAGVIPPPDPETARRRKETELSEACDAAIAAGMDVETSVGVEHFSLQESDQINLTTATAAVQSGAERYPYHADGKLCRLFSAGEILAIGQAATNHKLYHTTLCNHLLTWARRSQSGEEIQGITYSGENLPEDLAANMAAIFTAASGL